MPMSSSPTRPSCRRKAASSRTTASRCSPNAARCSSWTTWPSTSRPPAAPASSCPRVSSSRARPLTQQLRKMLVEEYLVAVVSLPAGVFNPYSGVKTSILILDKSLARQSDTIGFFKIENDGFGLGAQRRAHRQERPAASPRRNRRIPAAALRSGAVRRRGLPADTGPDRAEREDRRERRLQPERGAVSGGRRMNASSLPVGH